MQIPLPQVRGTSSPPFGPIQFNEESGITHDAGVDEIDYSCASESSLHRLARKERGEPMGRVTQWSVADNKQAEDDEAERQNGSVAEEKDSSGGKVS